MFTRDWKQLQENRNHDIATVLGSGPTINELTEQNWVTLQKRTDLWAVNNWVYHPEVVPNFYAIETKWYGYDLLRQRILEKKSKYNEVNFIFQRDKYIRMRDGSIQYIRNVADGFPNIFEYDVVMRDPKRTAKICDANYKYHPTAITKSYQASLTSVLELVLRCGYKSIILAGVDLTNSYYFWSNGDPKYGQVHHITNKAHEGKNPNKPHNTVIIIDFVIDFGRYMRERNMKLMVTSSNSGLYPDVPKLEWNVL